ncbi:MAG: hypothetical protein OHK0056_11320 [Bacteriovoracaceae bacterium]
MLEDSVVSQRMIEESLGKKFELKFAGTIKEGRSKIGNNEFDLLLFDINLPDGTSFDFYQEIIERGHHKCPIIFFSQSKDEENIIKGMQLGQCDFIFKPFNPDELLVRINTQIALYENTQKLISREKATLTGNFGHDINNPLMIALNAYKKLKGKFLFGDDPHARMIEDSLERMRKITQDYMKRRS